MSKPRKYKRRFKHSDDCALFTVAGEDVALAHQRSCAMGILPSSYTQGHGRITGCLGEIAVKSYLPRSRYVGDKVYSHDIVYKKQKLEVKSKICSGRPKKEFSAFVNGRESLKEKYDYDIVVFTRVRRDLVYVYIVGWLPAPTFFDEAVYYKRGDVDDTGFKFMSSGYQIPISELNSPNTLKSL